MKTTQVPMWSATPSKRTVLHTVTVRGYDETVDEIEAALQYILFEADGTPDKMSASQFIRRQFGSMENFRHQVARASCNL